MQATEEQQRAVEVFRQGQPMVIQAGAGTGKTTTLRMLGGSTDKHGLYIAFNSDVARDARSAFPSNVECRTAHSLAYRAIGHRYRARLDAPRPRSREVAASLGLTTVLEFGKRKVSPLAQSYAAQQAVRRYCHSAEDEIAAHHVPRLRGLEAPEVHSELVRVVLPAARRAWKELQDPDGNKVRFEHDHYLKLWALGRPRLDRDFILLDECQDTNPVVDQIFNAQADHAQLVMVGDSAQAIYGWRGARDVMAEFDGERLGLTRSFRFGPAVAFEANRWLSIVDAPIRLTGHDALSTTVGKVDRPSAVLCRTNAGAMQEVLEALQAGVRVALAGGGGPLKALASAAQDLKAGRRASHPELFLFSTWGEVQDYAEADPAGGDLLPLVRLVDEHGPDVILQAVERLSEERNATLVISTAHKAKGREWDEVRIADDFPAPGRDYKGAPNPVQPDMARLAYVAVTRAKKRLDLGGLAWIQAHPDGKPQPVRPPLEEVLPGEDREFGTGLFVDLVPESCWFTNVRSCVDQRDWDRLRTMVNRRAGHRCEICGAGYDAGAGRRLEAHERWDYDARQQVQRLRRIILLCSDCHRTTHYGLAQVEGKDRKAFQHLRRVTGMSEEQAQAHVRDAFDLWRERSQQTWTLDLSILEDAGLGLAAPPDRQGRVQAAAEQTARARQAQPRQERSDTLSEPAPSPSTSSDHRVGDLVKRPRWYQRLRRPRGRL